MNNLKNGDRIRFIDIESHELYTGIIRFTLPGTVVVNIEGSKTLMSVSTIYIVSDKEWEEFISHHMSKMYTDRCYYKTLR